MVGGSPTRPGAECAPIISRTLALRRAGGVHLTEVASVKPWPLCIGARTNFHFPVMSAISLGPNLRIFGEQRDWEFTVSTRHEKVTSRSLCRPTRIEGSCQGISGLTARKYLIGRNAVKINGENGAWEATCGIACRERDSLRGPTPQGEQMGRPAPRAVGNGRNLG